MNHNQDKNQSKETEPKVTVILESVRNDLSGIYRMLKDLKKNMNIMQRELEDIKK